MSRCHPRGVVCGLVLCALLLPVSARAQAGSLPESLELPARSRAIRPTGMALLRGGWMAQVPPDVEFDDDEFSHAHFVFQELEARIPIGSLLLEIAMGSSQSIYLRHADPDAAVVAYPSNPQLGASFIDAPAPGWRYELGGALVLPIDEEAIVDDACYGTPCFAPISPTGPTGEERAGWNAHRHAFGAMIGIAHARAEVDPIPQMALGLELDVPVYVFLDGDGANVFPQGAVEIAYRFLDASLVGLRARFTSLGHSLWFRAPFHDLGVALEPFVRMAFLEPSYGAFVGASLVLPLGPAYPVIGTHGFPGGYIGGSLELGTLY